MARWSSSALTFLRLHIETYTQVAARLEQPVIGGWGDVKGQPTLLSCRHRLHVQEYQLWLSGGKKIKTRTTLSSGKTTNGTNLHISSGAKTSKHYDCFKPAVIISLDLVDRDVQGSVCPLAHRQRLVDPKLRCSDRLTLREGRQVEAKLLPVWTRLQEVALLLHCTDRFLC